MKIKYQLLNQQEMYAVFNGVPDFLRQQSMELPRIPDSARVVMMEINDEPYPFEGSVAELFYELSR
ncbi:hypothetical protein [Lactococcus termiticola]|uniref:Uncharacterized protein n=1 Tax=Lactococcus termiticola TaxID=2169526 RepID=A0A2R5HFK8_9LACT|nr:hypothetical protein [Lactococcus termiticola]GBG96853.1 hypothetical protein NtB2_00978 [Lactococcus termiticola]